MALNDVARGIMEPVEPLEAQAYPDIPVAYMFTLSVCILKSSHTVLNTNIVHCIYTITVIITHP